MSTCVALLRGINVGKGKPVAMADLQAMMRSLGFADAVTLLRTGNIVFDAGARAPEALEALIAAEAARRLRLATEVYVRDAEAWSQAIARNPFPAEAKADPSHLLLVCLRSAPSPQALAALQAAIPGRERIKALDRHAYVTYPDGIAGSSLTPALWSRHLGKDPGTARNWNTVLKIAAAMRA